MRLLRARSADRPLLKRRGCLDLGLDFHIDEWRTPNHKSKIVIMGVAGIHGIFSS
jgi:hypothetical protein